MQGTRPSSSATTHQSAVEKVRQDARRFIDALAARLVELEHMARMAKRFNVFDAETYAEFKRLFISFGELSDEFQMLSQLAEASLSNFERNGSKNWSEYKELEEYFHKLQVPMLHGLINTNLRLLRIWDDRLQQGEGLPYGAREVFLETVRIIYNARVELLRPRYVALLDDSALRDADRAERLLRTLIRQAPKLFNFAEGDDQLGLLAADADEDYDAVVAAEEENATARP